MWAECTSVLRENLHNLFVLRNSVRILPIMAWALYFTGAGARDFFQMSCVPLLWNETFVEVRHFFAYKRSLANFKMWDCLILRSRNNFFIVVILHWTVEWFVCSIFLGYCYRSVRFREVVLSIIVPYSWLRFSTTLIPFFVYTDEQGFFGKVFWAFLHHAPSKQ